jgi:hypothetical protein
MIPVFRCVCSLQALSGALDKLQGRLQQRGLAGQAEALAGAKQGIVGAVSEAAGNIKSYVQVDGRLVEQHEVPILPPAAVAGLCLYCWQCIAVDAAAAG